MIVEVMAVSYEEDLPESECQYSMCPGESRNVFLVVCTERLNKLYEHNPKIDIDRRCQASIFWDIIEGVNNIASHFGFFKISKEMVGYNSDLKGKAWMNENYSSHKAGQPCYSL